MGVIARTFYIQSMRAELLEKGGDLPDALATLRETLTMFDQFTRASGADAIYLELVDYRLRTLISQANLVERYPELVPADEAIHMKAAVKFAKREIKVYVEAIKRLPAWDVLPTKPVLVVMCALVAVSLWTALPLMIAGACAVAMAAHLTNETTCNPTASA